MRLSDWQEIYHWDSVITLDGCKLGRKKNPFLKGMLKFQVNNSSNVLLQGP